ncbi:Rieske (2Fe-2S) protein [Roseibium litorale]|uniref:Rieske 2Fe-2S domain-containing protein n=1 Tax=Roseibium litorale TaxID=2803841 RepID=A0ABR9CRN3_9HYPH|nr:Rieske 2Fe-2S domain-containing protein [Roseibium litorale]MBD8893338.1 Rieske 2Fe-2S domain-containing protein [Roseibium litorale]
MPTESAYVICGLNDIPSKRAYGFYLARIDEDGNEQPWPIVIVRWGRQAFGYVNRCPHNGVNLDWERNQFLDAYGTRLMCGKHGALFDIGTGECVDGPCRGERLETIDVRVIEGEICVFGTQLAGYDDEEMEPGGVE